jgi:6-phosphogluconolactonase
MRYVGYRLNLIVAKLNYSVNKILLRTGENPFLKQDYGYNKYMIERSKVKIFPDSATLARAAAEQFIKIANNATQAHGIFSVALSGGSTPQQLYSLLGSEPFSEQVDWSKTHFFWGDERCVPPNKPDSNFLKAQQVLLSHIPIPEENIHRILAEMAPEQAAEQYEETLLRFFSSLTDEEERTQASFDLILLGMGDDGHTASLFPGTDVVNEERRWVRALYVDKLAAWRVTLTPTILDRARHILFLVSGAGKSYTLQRVLYGSYHPDRYPAQVIRADHGELLWMVDEAAAALF